MATVEARPAATEAVRSARGATALPLDRRTLTGLASVGIFLVAWQMAGSASALSASLFSYPTEVFAAGARLAATGELASNAAVSLLEFVYGFAPALVVGVVGGVGMGLSRRLGYLLEPLVMALYTAPRIALLPLVVIWFGIGIESKVAMVFLGAVFQILVNTVTGVRQVDEVWVRAARAYGASWRQVLTKVILPGSFPSIMTGVRLGIGRGIIGVVVGEMYVAVSGLGHLIQVYSSAARAADLLALVVVFALFGLVTVSLVRWIENRVGAWRQSLEA